jgi:hypothetical protein
MAQYNHDIVGACQNIQQEATALAGANAPFNLGLMNGALDFITSPDNQGNEEARLITSSGKLTKLEFFYDQRTKTCQISDTLANVCNDDTSSPVRKSATITIDNALSTPPRHFDNEEMVILCQNKDEFIRRRLFNDLRAAREHFSAKILATLESFAGKLIRWDGTTITDTGATSPAVQLLFATNGQKTPQPGNFVEIIKDYERMQLSGVPAIIGDGYFDLYALLSQLSCCNSTTPYADAIQTMGAAYFKDQQANTVLTNNHILVLPFGIVKLVTWNKNSGIMMNNDLEAHIVVPDPDGYPFSWNFDMKWDCTVERWKYVYSIEYTVFNVFQADSFATDGEGDSPDTSPDCNDELDGSFGVFKYHVTLG